MFLFQPLKLSPDMSSYKSQLESSKQKPIPTTWLSICPL